MGTSESGSRVTHPAWTFRPRGNVVYAVLTALAAAGWVWAASTTGWHGALRAAPWAALVALAGWVAFVRPCVVVADDGVTLVNPLRTVRVPWAALVHVTTRFAMTLHTPHGRYAAWAAPGPGRHVIATTTATEARSVAHDGGRTSNLGMGDLPSAASGVVAHQVRVRWQELVESGSLAAGEAETTPVAVTLAWPWVAAAGVLLAVGVATALLG